MKKNKKKILIFGAYGNLGNIISRYLSKQHQHIVFKVGRKKESQIYIRNYLNIPKVIKEIKPEIIINLIAETDVDKCEVYKKSAYISNVKVVKKICEGINKSKLKIKLIHLSTDQVYSKKINNSLNKENQTNPINYYSKTKLIGEKYALKQKAIILRTNFIGRQSTYSKVSLSDWIVSSLKNKVILKGYDNIYFNPIHTSSLCKILSRIIEYKKIYGVFNLGSKKHISKYNLIKFLLNKLNYNINVLKKINYSNKHSIAKRSLNMIMDCTKFEKQFKIKLPSINQELHKLLGDYQVKKLIPYGKHYIDKADIQSVVRALKKEKITTGEEVINFEKKINKFVKSNHSIACSSGSSALFLAMNAINVKKNDKIIMPAVNFVASFNIAKLFGAKVYLADVNPSTGQMQPQNIEDCINKFRLKKVKAIIVMYNGGYPENADKFKIFKKKLGSYIIEDACHAFGASYYSNNKEYKIGSCKHSDLCTFSFHPVKTITTGEGGIVTTNSKKFYLKMVEGRTVGISRKTEFKHWKYDVKNISLNFKLNDFQSALGSSQINKINKFINYRKRVFNLYNDTLKDIKQISVPKYNLKNQSSYHLFLINIKNFNQRKKERLIKFMLRKKIILQYHYIPLYKFKVFSGLYISENSEKYYNSTLSLPIFFGLKRKDILLITSSLRLFFKNL